jgi:hypothetical protein
MIHKIFYTTKMTNANTTYLNIDDKDMEYLLSKCIQIQSYFGEISLTKNKDIKDVYRWYTTSTKTLPYSNTMKRYNSPQSFISGTLNNLMFGKQNQISDTQSQHLQNLINLFYQLTQIINTDYDINLQKDCNTDSILFVENILKFD